MATKKAAFVLTDDFNEKSALWMEANAKLSTLKADELRLRNELIAMLYPTGTVPTGTNTTPLAEGWVIKVVGKQNITVDESLLGETQEMVKKSDPTLDFDAVIKMKPSLSLSGFNELTEEQKKLFQNCLITKPGQATVEIAKPKRAAA